jgi:MerR family transcriptional regulator, copper efflux regulator
MSTIPTSTGDSSSAVHSQRTLMTVGELSRRAGLSRKVIRELEGRGLIYTVGRSESNYRLFDESALWCTRTIGELRGLGLTLGQIEQLHDRYRAGGEQPTEAQFNQILDDVRTRLTARIIELQATIDRIDALRASTPEQCVGAGGWREDPCLTR